MHVVTVASRLLGLSLCVAVLSACVDSNAADDVRTATVPMQGASPDVKRAADGRLHLVFAVGADVYYAVSDDDGRTFARPKRVNSEAGSVQSGMFRGPELAFGAGDSVHIAWYGRAQPTARPPIEQSFMYSRLDAEGGFEPARRLSTGPVDGISIAALDHTVVATWQDGKVVRLAASADDGASFAVPADIGGVACECCDTGAVATPGGVFVVYRDRRSNLRDMYLLDVAQVEPTVRRRLALDATSWRIDACPMSSLGLARAGGDLFLAWEHDGGILLSRADTARWSRTAPVTVATRGKYPVAAVDDDQLVVAWKEQKTLHWRTFDVQTLRPLRQGRATTPSSGRPAAIAANSGGFILFP